MSLRKSQWCEFLGRKHGCKHGDACRHAHSWNELRPQADSDTPHEPKRWWLQSTSRSGWVDWQTMPYADNSSMADSSSSTEPQRRQPRSHQQYTTGDARPEFNPPPCVQRHTASAHLPAPQATTPPLIPSSTGDSEDVQEADLAGGADVAGQPQDAAEDADLAGTARHRSKSGSNKIATIPDSAQRPEPHPLAHKGRTRGRSSSLGIGFRA